MTRKNRNQAQQLYGTPQGLTPDAIRPVVARRDPLPSDTGYEVATPWINEVLGTVFTLVSNAGGVATWLSLGGSLTPAVASITTGPAATASLLAGNAWTATGMNHNIGLVATPKGNGGFSVTTGTITALAGDVVASANLTATTGNVEIQTAGSGLQIAEGANARLGVSAVMVAGVVIVPNTSVTANTRIFLTYNTPDVAANQGSLSYAIAAGVSFTISSSNLADTSTVNYLLIEAL